MEIFVRSWGKSVGILDLSVRWRWVSADTSAALVPSERNRVPSRLEADWVLRPDVKSPFLCHEPNPGLPNYTTSLCSEGTVQLVRVWYMELTWNSVLETRYLSFEFLETQTSQEELVFTHLMAFTLPCGFLCNRMVILRSTKLGKVQPCQPVFPCCTSLHQQKLLPTNEENRELHWWRMPHAFSRPTKCIGKEL